TGACAKNDDAGNDCRHQRQTTCNQFDPGHRPALTSRQNVRRYCTKPVAEISAEQQRIDWNAFGKSSAAGTRKTGEPPATLPPPCTFRCERDSIVVAVGVLAETVPARIVIEYLTVVLNQVDGSGWSEDVRVERDRAKLRGRGATKVVDRALDIRAALLPSTDAREKFSRSEDGIELRSGRRVSAANAGPMAARRVGCNGRNIRLKGHAFVVPQMAVLVHEERAGELDGVGPEIFVRLPILSAARP